MVTRNLYHFHLATLYGRTKVVSLLIKSGANVNRADNNTMTALNLGSFTDYL